MADSSVIGAFSEEHAGKLSGVSRRQLRHWDRIGLMRPSYGSGDTGLPYGRIYSFRDLVSLRVLGQLRNEHKVSLSHLKKVFGELSKLSDDPWASVTLQVLRKRVVIVEPGTKRKREVVGGQHVLDVPLRVVITGMRDAVAKLNFRGEDEIGKIVHGKFVAQNQPVFAGTRIPVTLVKTFIDAGYTANQIIKDYPDLTLDDIAVASAHVSDSAAA